MVSDVTSYYNKILFNKCQIGDSMYPSASQPVKVYMKSGKKWVLKATVKNGRPFQIKKLKPNTKYQFKFVSACKGPDGSLINGSSTVKTYRTGRKVKPAIRSISVSNVKVTYNSRFEKYMGKILHHPLHCECAAEEAASRYTRLIYRRRQMQRKRD